MVRRAATVAVWGHYHGGNLGDDFVVETIVAAIRRRMPDARIVAVSLNPSDSHLRHGVEAFPLNQPGGARSGSRFRRLCRRPVRMLAALPFQVRCLRFLRGVDLLVVAGSGQLLDEWGGYRAHPAAFFRWSLLARLARCPVALPSVGAGPLDSFLGRRLVAMGVEWAASVTVRDPHSRAVLAGAGVRRSLEVVPDMALGHVAERYLETRIGEQPLLRRGDAPLVGVNVMAHQDPRYWPRGDGERYERYLQKMATLVERLVVRGCEVCVFSSQTRSDCLVAEDLRALLDARGADRDGRVDFAFDRIETTAGLLATIRTCDSIVAARYHAILLSLVLGVPVVAQAYHPKTVDLMALMGQPHRVVDIDEFEADDLVARLEEAMATWSVADEREVARCRQEHGRAVERQFDELFGREFSVRQRAGAGAVLIAT